MSSQFPNGSIIALGTTLATAKTITAITNANPGVASSVAHGYSAGDILLLSMPSRLDQRVVRVLSNASPTDLFNLEGIDTTSTTLYPTGFGVGTAQKATAFVSLSQVTDLQTQGGVQQFYQWTYLEDGRQRQRPTFKNARALTAVLDYDPTQPWYAALVAADLSNTVYPLRITLPSGTIIYYSVYVSFSGEPTFTINENQKTECVFSFASPFSTRY